MIKNICIAILLIISVGLLTLLTGCAGSMGRFETDVEDIPGYDDIYPDWSIHVNPEKATAPALVTLRIWRNHYYNQPDVKIKYKVDDQPWVVASFQENTSNRDDQCDILLSFTTFGEYKITTEIFNLDDTTTGYGDESNIIVFKKMN